MEQISKKKNDSYGRSPLFKDCENGYEWIVKYFSGTWNRVLYNDIQTLLYIASEHGHHKVVQYLMDQRAR